MKEDTMPNRLATATCVTLAAFLAWTFDAEAGGGPPIKSIYVFGDSLNDTGNMFALSGGFEPPSPPYHDGRYSDGPVWIEYLAENLDLEVDLETPTTVDPLAHNQAVAGAFTDTRNANALAIPTVAGTGILGQIAAFEEARGKFRPHDLVIVWGGANNYIFDAFPDPAATVDDLVQAVEQLAELGARRFVVPNLPNLGDTPLGAFSGSVDALNFLTQLHNAELAAALAELREDLGLRIVLLDINAAFHALLANPGPSGFVNVTVPCLIQQEDGSRIATPACTTDGVNFDATGTFF
jgi:phospholipase/lecithinase/hemolysin